MAQAVRVLETVARGHGHDFGFDERKIGGIAIDTHGTPLRDEDVEAARDADGILLGAVGGPKWDNPSATVRPEQGLLKIRKALRLFANLRPVRLQASLIDASPLRPERVEGTDLVVMRELTGGLYFGKPSRQWRERRGRAAVDTLIYREHEIERIVRLAFELARTRKSKLTSVDKANVLSSSRLWRTVVTEVSAEYADVDLEHMLVDAMTMKLIQAPASFDVIVTENMFGDILSDLAGEIAGSLGIAPSLNSSDTRAMAQASHGSAPDIAGQDVANPVAMILSTAMLLDWLAARHDDPRLADAAARIERAVDATVQSGTATRDMGGSASCSAFTAAVVDAVRAG
jgi:3-isopropylmalate dehydrogenase